MPRVKSVDQTESLERQIKELTGKLNAAKAKAREEEREREEKKALVIGRAVLRELAQHPEGREAEIINGFLHTIVTRAADRKLLNLAPVAGGDSAVGNA